MSSTTTSFTTTSSASLTHSAASSSGLYASLGMNISSYPSTILDCSSYTSTSTNDDLELDSSHLTQLLQSSINKLQSSIASLSPDRSISEVSSLPVTPLRTTSDITTHSNSVHTTPTITSSVTSTSTLNPTSLVARRFSSPASLHTFSLPPLTD